MLNYICCRPKSLCPRPKESISTNAQMRRYFICFNVGLMTQQKIEKSVIIITNLNKVTLCVIVIIIITNLNKVSLLQLLLQI